MQRSSSAIYNFRVCCFASHFNLISAFKPVFSSFPIHFGLFFTYAIVKRYEKDKTYKDYTSGWYIAIIYSFIAEQIHGFKTFSVGIVFGIYYHFLFDYVVRSK